MLSCGTISAPHFLLSRLFMVQFRYLMKKLFSNRRLCAALLLFVAGVAVASRIDTQSAVTAVSQERSGTYHAAREDAQAMAQKWLARGIPGFSIAVARDGQI